MLNIDLMREKPLRGPLKRADADELQKALKDAGIRNPIIGSLIRPCCIP